VPHALPLVQRLVRVRVLVLSGAVALWFALVYPGSAGGDWLVFEYAGRILAGSAGPRFATLSHGPLHLYTDFPKAQIGPPALVAAIPAVELPASVGRFVAAALMAAALLPIVMLVERTALLAGRGADRTPVVTLIGGLLTVPVWTTLAVVYMHLDDVMALALLVVAMHELVRGRPWTMAIALGVGAASKPWAVAFLPLLLALPRPRRAPALLVSLAAASLCWIPFVVADPGTVAAVGNAGNGVAADSTVGLFVHVDPPGWAREVQLLVMAAVGTLIVRRAQWAALPVVVVSVRMATDWQTWGYYGAGLMVAALAWDLIGSQRRLPWATTLALAAAVVPPWLAGLPDSQPADATAAAARLLLLAALCGLVLIEATGARRNTGTMATSSATRTSTTATTAEL
jgi:hypothetical protein